MSDAWKVLAVPYICLAVATTAIWLTIGWVLQKVTDEGITFITLFLMAMITLLMWVTLLSAKMEYKSGE